MPSCGRSISPRTPRWRRLPLFLGCAVGLMLGSATAAERTLEFNRDIRPILSENCFACHGQDEARREGKLRLDRREGATQLRDGIAAIVPGKPDESELMRRVAATDPTDVMPPPESHKTLTKAQVEQLRNWIAQGATYEGHWAFQMPRKVELPAAELGALPNSTAGLPADSASLAIDRFVAARRAKENLPPAPAAAPGVWLRRVSLDLTGLPPTVAELDRFQAETSARGETAYVAAVDRLLASAHYGERMAVEWLDAARYADTHGFNNDSARTMWRWRDWVIDAFNSNLPYNRFITEQLAGDLLPQPTLEQRIATGFGRNHVINSEGGIIDEEYRVEYVADRVRTLSTVWLGLTMECARCHDHKFDPVTQKDYYRLFAFFNNVPEHGEDGRSANAVPIMPAPTRAQQAELAAQKEELSRLEARIATAVTAHTWEEGASSKVEALIATARTAVEAEKGAISFLEPRDTAEPAINSKAAGKRAGAEERPAEVDPAVVAAAPEATGAADSSQRKVRAADLDFSSKEGLTMSWWMNIAPDNPSDVALFSAMNHEGSPADSRFGNGREIRLIGGELELRLCDRFPAYAVIVRSVGACLQPGEWRHVALTYAGGRKAGDVRFLVDGEELPTRVHYDDLFGDPGKRDFLIGTDNSQNAPKFSGQIEAGKSFPRMVSDEALRALFRVRALPEALSARHENKGAARAARVLRDALVSAGEHQDLYQEHRKKRAAYFALQRSLPTVMVMEELAAPRPAFVLQRGQYDQPGEPVDAGVPEALLLTWPKGAPRNRLGLAQWLTDPRHPLVARVVVNRWWAQFFGTGLVKTLEDFGSQSDWPSHPELLDWLARDFVDGGWNVKAFVRSIVLSRTYRQSSAVSAPGLTADPENRLLARGPRLRLPAEIIRDQALSVAGLLAPKLGGPSVYPYQPDKLYESVVVGAAYPGTVWHRSAEPDLYRRSLYTFWKRTLPHPAMTIFDAPDREFCSVRRSRTNTPLQALILWNEPGLVEAARRFGTRLLRDAPGDEAARVGWAFQAVTGRKPALEESNVLLRVWSRLREDFAAHPAEAKALLQVGVAPNDGTLPEVEVAAATAFANVLLSLDEAISKN